MSTTLFLVSVTLATVFQVVLSGSGDWHWSYEGEEGPSYWSSHYAHCNGKKQSPIDVRSSVSVYDKQYGDITFNNYGATTGADYTLKNNGHTVQVDIPGASHYISGGMLQGRYKLAQLHFHWGSDNTKGSEHLIDGKQYPLEVHFVHYAEKYSDIGKAKDQPDGLAVVGIMFEIGASNSAMDILVKKFTAVKFSDQSTSVRAFALTDLMPRNKGEYFRYTGSLTTPSCDESVVWTVLRNPISISQSQMNAFRENLFGDESSSDSHKIVDNFRPVQNLGGRKIFSSFVTGKAADTVTISTVCLVISVILRGIF